MNTLCPYTMVTNEELIRWLYQYTHTHIQVHIHTHINTHTHTHTERHDNMSKYYPYLLRIDYIGSLQPKYTNKAKSKENQLMLCYVMFLC